MVLSIRAHGLLRTFLQVLVLRLGGGVHVAEHIVALLGEGDFVDGVLDVAVLEHEAGVALGVTAVNESLHMGGEPVDGIGPFGGGRGGEGRGEGSGEKGGEGRSNSEHKLATEQVQEDDCSPNHLHVRTINHSPRNEFGMTILSHLWSFRSSPELGPAIVRATSWMGVARVSFVMRSPGEG